MPQSRSRQRVHGSPKPRAFKSAPTALIASAEDRPSYFPLWIQRPDSAYPSFQRAAEYAWPLTSITGLIGKPYFCANAKSRASCAGTPITAPSPTRINTSFAIQTSMFWPVSGCWTKKPVAMPFFSVVAGSSKDNPPHLHSSRKRCSARQTRRQRMLRRNRAVGNPHDCIGARGKDAQRLRLTVQMIGKGNRHTLAFTEPILLHPLDALRPAEMI